MNSIDLTFLNRNCGAEGQINWSRGGVPTGSIGYRRGSNSVRFMYRTRPLQATEDHLIDVTVDFEWTGTAFGGQRAWFSCPAPRCGRRCRVLYIGSRGPLCRTCYQLAYPSQSERKPLRALARAQRLRMRLNGSPSMVDPFPDKPKGMHWSTYDRLQAQHDQLSRTSMAGLAARYGLRG